MAFSCWSLFHCSQAKKCSTSRTAFGLFERSRLIFLRCPCWRGCGRPVVQCRGAWTLTSVSHWYSDNVVCQIGRCIEESLAFPIYLNKRVDELGARRSQVIQQRTSWRQWCICFWEWNGSSTSCSWDWGQWSHWGTRSGHRLRDFLTWQKNCWDMKSSFPILSSFKLHFS